MQPIRQRTATFSLVLLCLCMSGCGTIRFYSQAIRGQAEILGNARPVAEVMRDENVPAGVKRKLTVVQDARRFSITQLGLPGDRQYDRYTDLHRSHVSWVVFKAAEFSVEAKTWWYPLLGRLEYRGYFAKSDAENEAARLKARGLEVFVGEVEAYSTLGWFRDPIINTFLHRPDAELAELIFHELTHVRLFLHGDTEFNEAFATANAENAVRRWLKAKGDLRGLVAYEARLAKDREVIRLLLDTRQKLKRLYADKSRDPEAMRRGKEAIFKAMREEYARWHGDSRYDRALAKPWNNARLNSVATYFDLVPAFERLLKREDGDLKSFCAEVGKMRHMTKGERRARLRGEAGTMSANSRMNSTPR